MKLEPPKLVRKPHFEIWNSFADDFTRCATIGNDVGGMDRSKGYGEIKYYSPDDAKEYLLMPHHIADVQATVHRIEDGGGLKAKIARAVEDGVLRAFEKSKLPEERVSTGSS